MKEPANVVVFACNWNGWSCVEAAGRNRLSYPSSVKVVRVNCLSRVDAGLMLKALHLGADGVMLLGCQADNCFYGTDEASIAKQYDQARRVLSLLGWGEGRLILVRLVAGDGAGFVKHVNNFLSRLEKMSAVA
ncbi:MAG: hydrogenase iron-sulfur subunit [Chloroflexota bacterium]